MLIRWFLAGEIPFIVGVPFRSLRLRTSGGLVVENSLQSTRGRLPH